MMAQPSTDSRINAAEAHLIQNSVAMHEAARQFGVSLNSLRSRIESRYGSLREARDQGYRPPAAPATRPCLRCRSKAVELPRRMCDPCNRAVAALHDGHV